MDLKKIKEDRIMIHNKQLSKQILEHFECMLDLEFIDISYHNDALDSIGIESLNLQIFLPNSIFTDERKEYFNEFMIVDLDGETDNTYLTTKDIDEVIEYLEEQNEDYIFTNLTTCRNGKLMKDCKCC